jgi:hypothetical protein
VAVPASVGRRPDGVEVDPGEASVDAEQVAVLTGYRRLPVRGGRGSITVVCVLRTNRVERNPWGASTATPVTGRQRIAAAVALLCVVLTLVLGVLAAISRFPGCSWRWPVLWSW